MTRVPDLPSFRHDPDPDEGTWAGIRFEGCRALECLPHGVSYLRKYRRKKGDAPARLRAHFSAQADVRDRLAAGTNGAAGDARVALVGDMMWIRDGWESFVGEDVLAHLGRYDAVVGNLESVVSPRFKVPSLFPDYLRFNSHPGLVTSFRRADGSNLFSALALANNHILDLGTDAALDTLAFVEAQGIVPFGMRRPETEPAWREIRAGPWRIGLFSATWGHNDAKEAARTPLRIDVLERISPRVGDEAGLEGAVAAIREMRAAGVDLVVLSLHWGHEFELYPRGGHMAVARALVAAGADVIAGHHPHVTQPAEILALNGYGGDAELPPDARMDTPDGAPRKALVLYSLGNFVTTMYTPECRLGAIQELALYRAAGRTGADWRLGPRHWAYNWERHPDHGRRVLTMLDAAALERRPPIARAHARLTRAAGAIVAPRPPSLA